MYHSNNIRSTTLVVAAAAAAVIAEAAAVYPWRCFSRIAGLNEEEVKQPSQ